MALTVAELLARLHADTGQFTTAMTRATGTMKAVESSGASMAAVTKIAFAGMAIAALKGTSDFIKFQDTMTRLVTLAGISENAIGGLTEGVKKLAPAVGKTPQELAEGLYFVASAGFQGRKAMEVLTASAKGAAIGLGTVETVADAVTSVMNAYGQETYTAARVTAILREAVEQSKVEADAMAGAIGRVLPIASTMGVEFEQVAGSLAAMTRTGLDANEATTALRGILSGLLDPTDRATKLLTSAGISITALQDAVRTGNIVGVLQDLEKTFEGNSRAMSILFPNIRALIGEMNLAGESGEMAAQIYRDVAAATEQDLNVAFEQASQTIGFKLRQAWASLSVALLDVGQSFATLAGLAAGAIKAIAPLLQLIPPLIAAFVAWKVATLALTFLPALLFKVALAMEAVGAAAAASRLANFAAGLAAIGPAAAAIIGVGVAVGFVAVKIRDFIERDVQALQAGISSIVAATTDLTVPLDVVRDRIEAMLGTGDDVQAFTARVEELRGRIQEISHAFEVGTITAAELGIRVRAMGEAFDLSDEQINALIESMIQQKHAADGTRGAFGGVEDAAQDMGHAVRKWAGLSGEALKSFRSAAETSLAAAAGSVLELKKGWELTSREGVRNMKNMADRAREMAKDMKALDTEAVPDKFKAFLIAEGPEAVRAFVRGTKEQKGDFLAAWREYNQGMQTTVNNMKKIASVGGESTGHALAGGIERAIHADTVHVAASAANMVREAIAAARAAAKATSPSQEMAELGKDMIRGLIQGMQSMDKEIRESAVHAAEQLSKQLENSLSQLQKKLDAVQSRASSFRSAIAGSFGPFVGLEGAGETEDVAAFVAQAAQSAQTWAGVLRALKTAGIGGPLLAQIAAMGPEAIGFAQQVLALAPDQLKALNEQYNAILELQKSVSGQLTQSYFGDRINALQNDLQRIRELLHSIDRSLAHVKSMQGGGYVSHNTLAALHAGETVVPKGDAGMDVTINVGDRSTARDVVRELEWVRVSRGW